MVLMLLACNWIDRGTFDESLDRDQDGVPAWDDCDDDDPLITVPSLDWFEDADGDGFGSIQVGSPQCFAPTEIYVRQGGDCDDTDPLVSPGQVESCTPGDDDCDGLIDEADPSLPESELLLVYRDQDGDGVGAGSPSRVCVVPVGWSVTSGDCHDGNDTVFPGAPELCDTLDNDCDDATDEDVVFTDYFLDSDGDGYGSNTTPIRSCAPVQGRVDRGGDCDDFVASTFPGAPELCDSIDNNCDGDVDDGVLFLDYYLDSDGDGYGSDTAPIRSCSPIQDRVTRGGDCDDFVASTFPDASELCDNVDNNCDGDVDEGVVFLDYYLDNDQDGYGSDLAPIQSCTPVPGRITQGGDCDDLASSTYNGAPELCDGVDNDCNGLSDDGVQDYTVYVDVDGDGVGAGPAIVTCNPPAGTVSVGGDCDDGNAAISPELYEACDGIDNNCDGSIDEGVTLTHYADSDGDYYGDPLTVTIACDLPPGRTLDGTDCDDADPTINPGSPEVVADGVDQNCDGVERCFSDEDGDGFGSTVDVASPGLSCSQPGFSTTSDDCDDDDPDRNPVAVELPADGVDGDCDGVELCYIDQDGDGSGSSALASSIDFSCLNPGRSPWSDDCDDGDPTRSPLLPEICNGQDDDCNLLDDDGLEIYDWRPDLDGDGYGDSAAAGTQTCNILPPPFVANASDCDDQNPLVFIGMPELCDGVDNDCNLLIDDDANAVSWWIDQDGDGVGTTASEVVQCAPLAGYALRVGDCDDTEPHVYPGASEVCDGLDNNCDGSVADEAGMVTTQQGSYRNLQTALDLCEAPCEVHVCPAADGGPWIGDFVTPPLNDVSLFGHGAHLQGVWDAQGGPEVPVVHNPSLNTHLLVSNLEISGGWVGIQSCWLTVRDANIHSNRTGIRAYNSGGAWCRQSSVYDVQDSRIEDNEAVGIDARYVDGSRVSSFTGLTIARNDTALSVPSSGFALVDSNLQDHRFGVTGSMNADSMVVGSVLANNTTAMSLNTFSYDGATTLSIVNTDVLNSTEFGVAFSTDFSPLGVAHELVLQNVLFDSSPTRTFDVVARGAGYIYCSPTPISATCVLDDTPGCDLPSILCGP